MATGYGGYTGEFLDVDLTTGAVGTCEVTDRDRRMLIGGKALAAKLLLEETPAGADPLGGENVLIINTGPLTASGAPCTSRFNVTTKSPLTGGILSSNCGGSFGFFLKRAGYDGIFVRGRAAKPVYIEIDNGEVSVRDASSLWGLDTEATQEALPKGGKAVIGPAGENLVRYASIISQERAAGRGGAGAVMGSKNLKAIVARGGRSMEPADPERFKKAVKAWVKTLTEHPTTGGSLPKYGTAGFLNKMNASSGLPTRNFAEGSFEGAEEISGEALTEKLLEKNFGCLTCPIKCGRRVILEGKSVKGPEFETLCMFGSDIGNSNLAAICEWNRIMDLLGFDTITAGGTIAFAMELNRRGMWSNGLEFGKTHAIAGLLEDIAHRRGLGGELAEGSLRLARKYGGAEFAMQVKGMELAAYDPRASVGMGLGYAVANRGACHLDSGYLVFLERLGPINIDPFDTANKPSLAVMQQNLMEAVSSSGNCLFTTYAVIPAAAHKIKPYGTAARALTAAMGGLHLALDHLGKIPAAAMPFHVSAIIPHTEAVSALTGMNMTLGNFLAAGERSWNLARLYNLREGFTAADDTLPARLTEEAQAGGGAGKLVKLEEMIKKYYSIRGWNSKGVPRRSKLRALDIRSYGA